MSHPIKVLQIVSRNPYGGIYRVITDLFDSLTGNELVALHAALIAHKTYTGDFSLGNNNIPQTEIKGNRWSMYVKLKTLAKDYDIIHLHGFSPWSALAVLTAKRRLVYTNHGLLGTGRKLQLHEYLKRWLMKIFLRYFVDHIVNISEYTRDLLIKEYRVPCNKNSVVWNCTRWETRPPKFQYPAELIIGFHGRFVSFKRIDRLIEVAKLVRKKRDTKVVLIGNGPLKEALTLLARQEEVPLEIVDYQHDIRSCMDKFNIEIFPSEGEPFGLSALEAIQAGIPTFVFQDGGGCKEIFGPEAQWFVCKTTEEMANKILSMDRTETRASVSQMMERLQEYVENTFSPERFAAGYLRAYQSVAGR